MTCLCGDPVPSPYLRIAWGERGGSGSYREVFFCSVGCVAEHERALTAMLESVPA